MPCLCPRPILCPILHTWPWSNRRIRWRDRVRFCLRFCGCAVTVSATEFVSVAQIVSGSTPCTCSCPCPSRCPCPWLCPFLWPCSCPCVCVRERVFVCVLGHGRDYVRGLVLSCYCVRVRADSVSFSVLAGLVRVRVGIIIIWGSIVALGSSELPSFRDSPPVPVWLNIEATTECTLIE